MAIPKTTRKWSVTQSEKDGCPFIEMSHPQYGAIISMSQAGTDPQITYDSAYLAALEEELRNAPNDRDLIAAVGEQRNYIVMQKRMRSAMAQDASPEPDPGAEGDE